MIRHSLTSTTSTPTGFILVARDVHKSFGQTPALTGADLSVAAGEIVAVMGRAGQENRRCCTVWPGCCVLIVARCGSTVAESIS